LGGTVVQQRLGYDPGANVISGQVEQDSQTLEIDGGQSVLDGTMGLNVGWGATFWGQTPERMLLRDTQGSPVLFSRPLTPSANAINVLGHWTAGAFLMTAAYANADTSFDNTLSDTLNGAKTADAKMTLKFDQIAPFKNKFADPGVMDGLAQGLEFSVEGKSYASAEPNPNPYESTDLIMRLGNEDDKKLGYILYVDGKVESKPLQSGEPLQLSDRVDDMRVVLRARPWDGASLQALGGLRWREEFYDGNDNVQGTYQGYDSTVGLRAAQSLGGKHSLTFSVGRFAWVTAPSDAVPVGFPQAEPTSVAVQAGLHSQWLPGLSTDILYGRAPFENDIMDSAWVNLDPETTLRLDGSF